MESEYYIPDISEFYAGFEYELNEGSMDSPDWVKRKYEIDDFICPEHDDYGIDTSDLEDGYIRVKYLDVEDIESLGFTFGYQEFGGTCSIVGSNNEDRESSRFIGIQFEEDWHGILSGPTITIYSNSERLFRGVVKNKSELKQMLKMIGHAD